MTFDLISDALHRLAGSLYLSFSGRILNSKAANETEERLMKSCLLQGL